MKPVRCFILSAAVLLSATALAELIAGAGSGKTLQALDPLLSLPFRSLLWSAGAAQLVIALVCVASKRAWPPATLLAWLSASFALYRIGLSLTDYHLCCCSSGVSCGAGCCSDRPCVGDLAAALHISVRAADTIAIAMAAYLLLGSAAVLLWSWKKATATPRVTAG